MIRPNASLTDIAEVTAMQAPGSLTAEQASILGTVFHFIESSVVYFRSILPVVGETDERLLKALVELAEQPGWSLRLSGSSTIQEGIR